MAIAAYLLQPKGEMAFIIPRSFASGPYFMRLREKLFKQVQPVRAHIFDSRRAAFNRDAVLQENVILHAVRDEGWSAKKPQNHFFITSASMGIDDLAQAGKRRSGLTEAINPCNLTGVFRFPLSKGDRNVLRRMDAWLGSLHAYGLEISTGPVVPFRATKFFVNKNKGDSVPLLWMRHIRAMTIELLRK